MGKVSGEQILFGILAYLGILVLIPLLLKKDDKFIHHHSKQGLVLLIAWIAIGIFTMVPLIGWIFGPLIYLVLIVFWIIAIIKVATGQLWVLPIIGKFADKLKI